MYSSLQATDVFIILAMLVGFFILWLFFGDSKCNRTFKKHQKNQIARCVDGNIVKVQGHVQCIGKPLIAVGSGAECAGYDIEIQRGELENYSKESSSFYSTMQEKRIWRKIKSQSKVSNFLLEQKGDYALVCTEGSQVVWQYQDLYTRPMQDPAKRETQEKVLALMALIGAKNCLKQHDIACAIEALLLEGNEVVILGVAHWRNIEDYEYLEFLKQKGVDKILVYQHTEQTPLYVSQDPKHLNSFR